MLLTILKLVGLRFHYIETKGTILIVKTNLSRLRLFCLDNCCFLPCRMHFVVLLSSISLMANGKFRIENTRIYIMEEIREAEKLLQDLKMEKWRGWLRFKHSVLFPTKCILLKFTKRLRPKAKGKSPFAFCLRT